jgi:hypothetical protein
MFGPGLDGGGTGGTGSGVPPCLFPAYFGALATGVPT